MGRDSIKTSSRYNIVLLHFFFIVSELISCKLVIKFDLNKEWNTDSF